MTFLAKLIIVLVALSSSSYSKCHPKGNQGNHLIPQPSIEIPVQEPRASGQPTGGSGVDDSKETPTSPPPEPKEKETSSNSGLYGLGYNAKHSDGRCSSYEKVLNDFVMMSKVTKRIRTFGLFDCNQGELIVKASQATGMHVSLGLFVNHNDGEFQREFQILQDLTSKYASTFANNIDAVIVSSETIYRNETTHEEIARKVDQVKRYLGGKNFPTLTTAAEVKDNWYPSALYDSVEVMYVNAYPFWENVRIEDGVSHLFDKIKEVKDRVYVDGKPHKEFVLGETGWPEGGMSKPPALPSKENQIRYFNEFYCRAKKENLKYYWFSAFDEAWKGFEADAKWGILTEDGQLKPGYVIPPNCS